MRLLVIKTSSLGDILNTLPAVSDAARARPGIEIDWVVEEAFAAAPGWHPAVSEVIPVNLRRWRRRFSSARWEASSAGCGPGATTSSSMPRGWSKALCSPFSPAVRSAGFDYPSARESIAALAYRRHATASWEIHAIDRQRRLFAQALGYPLPETPPDFGLPAPPRPPRPRLLLLHGTTWATKRWPESHWIGLARQATAAGVEPVLRWHGAEERAEAERIAAAAPGTLRPAGARPGNAAPGDRRGQRGGRQ